MEDLCSVSGCLNRLSTDLHLEFYKFPFGNKYRLRRWVEYANRGKAWIPTTYSVICEEHFAKPNERKPPVCRKLEFPQSQLPPELIRETVLLTFNRVPLTLSYGAKKLKGGGVIVGPV